MFGLGALPHSARKYIDLIFAASSKWANWDPPKQIKVDLTVTSSLLENIL